MNDEERFKDKLKDLTILHIYSEEDFQWIAAYVERLQQEKEELERRLLVYEVPVTGAVGDVTYVGTPDLTFHGDNITGETR